MVTYLEPLASAIQISFLDYGYTYSKQSEGKQRKKAEERLADFIEGIHKDMYLTTHALNRLLFAKMASPKPQSLKQTSRRQRGLDTLLVDKMPGVVGSAETNSPSRRTLVSLWEASILASITTYC